MGGQKVEASSGLGRRGFLLGLSGVAAASRLHAQESRPQNGIRIGFFTDVHAMTGRGAPEKMEHAAAVLGKVECDVLIGGGDFLHGGFTATEEEMVPRIQLCERFLKKIGRPVEPMLGNHDLIAIRPADGSAPSKDPSAAFRKLFQLESPRRTLEVGGTKFFFLESVEPDSSTGTYRGWIGPEQREWIASELSKTPGDQSLVLCSHIPLQTTFMQVKEGPSAALPPALIVQDSMETMALFANHNLRLILQGHLRVNEGIRWNDKTFLMGGAVSGAWWGGPNMGTSSGFALIRLLPGKMDWEYVVLG